MFQFREWYGQRELTICRPDEPIKPTKGVRNLMPSMKIILKVFLVLFLFGYRLTWLCEILAAVFENSFVGGRGRHNKVIFFCYHHGSPSSALQNYSPAVWGTRLLFSSFVSAFFPLALFKRTTQQKSMCIHRDRDVRMIRGSTEVRQI